MFKGRQYTNEEKKSFLKDFKEANCSMHGFAKEKNIPVSTLRKYIIFVFGTDA